MTRDITRLVQTCFESGETLFLAPAIPPGKLAGAHKSHQATLAGETVLVLYDDTVFGGAEDGFVITASGLWWKNLMEPARQIRWDEFRADEVTLSASGVMIGAADLSIGEETVGAALKTFLCEIASAPATGPERLDARSLVRIARKYLGTPSEVFFAPGIPDRKLRTALSTHGLSAEDVLVIYDDTVFGSAENGFMLTLQGVYWKNLTEDAVHAPWPSLETADLQVVSGGVALPQGKIDIGMVSRVGAGVVDLLRALAWLAVHGVLHPEAAATLTPGTVSVLRCPYCRVRVTRELRFCVSCGAPQ